jgi:hypothetical protein
MNIVRSVNWNRLAGSAGWTSMGESPFQYGPSSLQASRQPVHFIADRYCYQHIERHRLPIAAETFSSF